MAIRHEYDDDQAGDLIIKVAPELRKRIKIAAEQSGLSVQEYVSLILEQTVPPIDFAERRSGRLNRAAVEELKQYREEIKRVHPGQVFEDSSELIHQAREERTRELEQR